MALVHRATLSPTKRELLDLWLPRQSWFDGSVERRPVGSFRLDDPGGEVGIEGFLLGSPDGSTIFVPLTYRGAPLRGAEPHLIGETQHSVLGPRWIYDGCGDPVCVAALASVIRTGGRQADVHLEVDGAREPVEPATTVRGSGDPAASGVEPAVIRAIRDIHALTTVAMGRVEVVVVRAVGLDPGTDEVLTGRLRPGSPEVVLAGVRPTPVGEEPISRSASDDQTIHQS